MNTAEFTGWDIRRELSYMRKLHPMLNGYFLITHLTVPISLLIILVAFFFAFSPFARRLGSILGAILSFLFNVSWTFILTKTGLFSIWDNLPLTAESITDKKKILIRAMEEKARKQIIVKRVENWQKRDLGVQDKKHETTPRTEEVHECV